MFICVVIGSSFTYSFVVPVDEVIDAMGDVGRRMPVEFRETALGGLATTPTGQEIKRCMNKKEE